MSYPRCPYCLDDLQPDQETVRCAECRTPHHQPCFHENGGCVAFGCMSMEEVVGGLSIFTKPKFQIHHAPTSEVELGPFILGFRKLVSIPEKRSKQRCPPSYARLTIENRELREGDMARGRGVIYVPERTQFKRIDLYLFQGIQRPQEIGRMMLVKKGNHTLERGSHPFYLELRAPPAIPFLDPFQLELCLVHSLFKELRSAPLPLFLLQRRFQRKTAGEQIRVRPSGPVQVQVRPPAPHGVAIDPFAGQDPFAEPNMPAPRAASNGWHDVPVNAIGSLYDSGGPTGRSVRVRFCPAPGAPKKRIVLESPSRPASPEFPVRIVGGDSLSSLNVAIHYGLVRPGGGDVEAPGFPAMEEVRLLGGGGSLESARYGEGTGLELVMTVPPERMAAFAHVRETTAHNAALRIHFALDAIDRSGRVLSPVSRAVTFTTP